MVTVATTLRVECIPVCLSNALNGNQNDHGVRCASAVVGREATEEAQRSLLLEDLDGAVRHAAVGHLSGLWDGLLCHQSGLDQIERQTEQGGREAGNGRGTHLGGEGRSVGHGIIEQLGHHLLGLVVARQHTNVHGHTTEDVGCQSLVQGTDALLLGRSDERVEHILIVSAVLLGGHAVGLQSHQGNVKRSADADGDGTTGHTRQGLGKEVDRLAIVPLDEGIAEGPVQADTGRTVHHLSADGGIDSLVDGRNAVLLHNLLNDGTEAGDGLTGVELTIQLHSNLFVSWVFVQGGQGWQCWVRTSESDLCEINK